MVIKYGFEVIVGMLSDLVVMLEKVMSVYLDKMKVNDISFGIVGLFIQFWESEQCFWDDLVKLLELVEVCQCFGVKGMGIWIMFIYKNLSY